MGMAFGLGVKITKYDSWHLPTSWWLVARQLVTSLLFSQTQVCIWMLTIKWLIQNAVSAVTDWLLCCILRWQLQSPARPLFTCYRLTIKEVMSWPKVSSLVFRFWSLPWTNGPNTQLKWKFRYSPIQCAYLEPSATHFSDRRRTRIGLEIGN